MPWTWLETFILCISNIIIIIITIITIIITIIIILNKASNKNSTFKRREACTTFFLFVHSGRSLVNAMLKYIYKFQR